MVYGSDKVTPKIYLAGPINGLTPTEANEWKQEVTCGIHDLFDFRDPMRNKSRISPNEVILGEYRHLGPLYTPAGIVARDRNDVKTCDAIVGYFHPCHPEHFGLAVEIGWATAWEKPVILYIPQLLDHHRYHPFITGQPIIVANTADEVQDVLKSLFY
jgi:nucleoside 2-deoxyribosyltransferase